MGYHGWTFGWILGEVVRRVTGLPLSAALRSYVSGPLGVEDSLFFGLPGSEHHRTATLVDGGWDAAIASLPDSAAIFTASPRPVAAGTELGNQKNYLSAHIPSAGTMTAAAVARMYAALLTDTDGIHLLPASTAKEAARQAVSAEDRMLGHPSPKTLGYFHGITWAAWLTPVLRHHRQRRQRRLRRPHARHRLRPDQEPPHSGLPRRTHRRRRALLGPRPYRLTPTRPQRRPHTG